MAEYKLLRTEGRAKRGELKTVHGTIQTPVFMNVGTVGAIKGAVSTMDLKEIGTQVEREFDSLGSPNASQSLIRLYFFCQFLILYFHVMLSYVIIAMR